MRTELTNSDLTEANPFTFVESRFLSDDGVDLIKEAKTQVSYYLHMENLLLKVKNMLTESSTISTSLYGPSSFLKYSASLHESCPELCDSLIVALLNASINRTMGNGKEALDDKVVNFHRFVQTFSP